MTRRVLFGLLFVLVVVIRPVLKVMFGVVDAVRYIFRDRWADLEGSTVSRIKADSDEADRQRGLLETRVVLKPSVMDRAAPTSIYDREVPR